MGTGTRQTSIVVPPAECSTFCRVTNEKFYLINFVYRLAFFEQWQLKKMKLMKINTQLRDEIFQVIKNQIKSNNPPETKVTYDRLIASGYSEFETNQLIGQCIAIEIYGALKEQKPYDEARYISNMKQLPKEPF